MKRRTMPRQKPGKSKQTYETPEDLLHAIRARWRLSHFDLDLAATDADVSKAKAFISPSEDSLLAQWPMLGALWLNPPFGNIAPWAAKAARWVAHPSRHPGSRLFMLVPASVGSVWFSQNNHRQALNLALQPRVTFVGESAPFIKDLVLSVFGETPGFGIWRWQP